ncbi:hypothetical protein JTB14_033843 [Gonioctena quinquepunctata]|nr:hypothetical protein JTB14_033843 [Gonioctena quinquepunctata]
MSYSVLNDIDDICEDMELTYDEDFVEAVEDIQRNSRRHPKKSRERMDHFQESNDEQLVQRLRLSKQGVCFVINQVEAQISSPTD